MSRKKEPNVKILKSIVMLFLVFLLAMPPTPGYAGSGPPGNGGNQNQPILPPGDLPPSPPLSPSAPVGRMADTLTVTQNGEAVYSVPIQAAPGRGGIAPSLALVYNSRGEDGPVGIRWSISGLSSIDRCGSSYATDGVLRRVEYDEQDHLCFAGARLIEIPRSDGVWREFRTDVETFTRITTPRVTYGEPQYFIVETKDGKIIRYGCDDPADAVCMSSVVMARNDSPRGWAVSEVRDRFGNYMTFEYWQDYYQGRDGEREETVEILPLRIRYTGNDLASGGGLAPDASVEFGYQEREDIRYGFHAGLRMQISRLLRNINVYVNDVETVRKYQLEYDEATPSRRSQLISISESDWTGVTKPALQFEWQNGEAGFAAEEDTGIEVPQASRGLSLDWRIPNLPIAIDVDGNGLADLVYPFGGTWRIIFNDGAGFHGLETAVDTEESAIEPPVDGPYPALMGRPFDYNMDGRMDILLFDESPFWEVLVSTGSSLIRVNTGIPVSVGDYITFENKSNHTFLADVNGDGMEDLLYCFEPLEDYTRIEWKYRLHTGYGFGDERIITDETISGADNALVLDYNGDGAQDLLVGEYMPYCESHTCLGVYTVFYFTGSSPVRGLTNLPYYIESVGGHPLRKVFDMNGDGLQDVLYAETTGERWPDHSFSRMWINTGEGFIGGSDGIPAIREDGALDFEALYYAQVFDYNGDGILDLLLPLALEGEYPSGAFPPPRQWGRWVVCKGLGNYIYGEVDDLLSDLDNRYGFSTPVDIDIPFYSYDWSIQNPIVTDLNGDLVADLVTLQDDVVPETAHHFVMHRHSGTVGDLIVKIRNGLIGIDVSSPEWNYTWTYKIEYKSTVYFAVYSRVDYYNDPQVVPPCSYPLLCSNPRLLVVSSVSTDNGVGEDPTTMNYLYRNSRFDLRWGWLGFGQRMAMNYAKKLTIATQYDNYTYDEGLRRYPYRGMVVREYTEVELDTGNIETTCTNNYYNYKTVPISGYRTYYTYPSYTYTESKFWNGRYWDMIKMTSQSYTWDDYANIVTMSENTSSVENRVETDYQYDVDNWVLGLPTTITSTWSSSVATESRITSFSYDDPIKMLVTKTVREPGDHDLQLTTDFDYDDFGNLIFTENYGMTGPHRVSWIMLDAERLFPSQTVNSLGHATGYRYHRGLGIPTVVQDPNGVSQINTYDGFGRPTSVSVTDGTITQTTQTAYSIISYDGCFGGCKTKVEVSKAGAQTVATTLDRLGRPIIEEVEGFGGKIIRKQISYNDSGLVERVEYLISPTGFWQRYFYDNANRLIETWFSDGAVTRTEYLGRQINHYDAKNNLTTHYLNELGQLERVTDALGGMTVYGYGSFGSIALIVDAAHNTKRIVSDKYGRVTLVLDPDTGTTHNTYNVFGELISTTDNSGVTTIMTYDSLGRLEERSDPRDGGGVDHYVYDTEFIGMLSGMSSSWGHSEDYTYDGLGRISEVKTKIEGVTYQQKIIYDSFGRVSEYHYPDNIGEDFAVRYEYDPYGYLQYVRDLASGTVYRQLTGMDEMGRITDALYGNGLDLKVEYDSASGNLTNLKTMDGSDPLQWLKYEYDDNRNVITRTEVTRQVAETFTYDELNRLKESNMSGAGLFQTPEGEPIPITEADYHLTYSYDEIGNIEYKSDVGIYLYNPWRPHAVASAGGALYIYNMVGNQTYRPNEMLGYTSFNKLKHVTIWSTSMNWDFEYDGNHNRVLKTSSAGEKTVYVGGVYEKLTDASGVELHRYYVSAGGASVAVVTKQRLGGIIDREVVYVHGDHLGSASLITNESKGVVQRTYFDAFGQSRQYHWGGPPTDVSVTGFTRGFTGHEHDENGLNLINMGGREYDPRLGRFLSADPLTTPFDSQGLNRYSYVSNNPLNKADPTGYGGPLGSPDNPIPIDPTYIVGYPPNFLPPLSPFDRAMRDLVDPRGPYGADNFTREAGDFMERFVSAGRAFIRSIMPGPDVNSQVLSWDEQVAMQTSPGEDGFAVGLSLMPVIPSWQDGLNEMANQNEHLASVYFTLSVVDVAGLFLVPETGGASCLAASAGTGGARAGIREGLAALAEAVGALTPLRQVVVDVGVGAHYREALTVVANHPGALIVFNDIDPIGLRITNRWLQMEPRVLEEEVILARTDIRSLLPIMEGRANRVYIMHPRELDHVPNAARLLSPGGEILIAVESTMSTTLPYHNMRNQLMLGGVNMTRRVDAEALLPGYNQQAAINRWLPEYAILGTR